MLFYRNHYNFNSATGATLPPPSGWAVDDILLIQLETTSGEDVPLPAGWTALFPTVDQAGTRLYAFWKRAVADEANVVLEDNGDHLVGLVIAIGGAIKTGNPFTQVTAETSSGTSVSFPSITPPSGGYGVLNLFGYGRDSGSDPLASYTVPQSEPSTEVLMQRATTTFNGGAVAAIFAILSNASPNVTTATAVSSEGHNRASALIIPEPGNTNYLHNGQVVTTVQTYPDNLNLLYNFQMITVVSEAVATPAAFRRRGFMSFTP